MSDNKSKRGPQDATRVNLHEPYEVEYWRRKFGCSEIDLVGAVNAVGVSANAVTAYFVALRPKPAPDILSSWIEQGIGQTQNGPASPADWSVIFFDDFTVDTLLDPNGPWYTGWDWGQTLGDDRAYPTRYYKNFATACNPGLFNHVYTGTSLKLEAKYEPGVYEVWSWPVPPPPPPNQAPVFTVTCVPYDFTSGMIRSKQVFLYGYFEIRCKIPPSGQQLWPSFWLYAGGGSGPDAYREIDIFEFVDPPLPSLPIPNDWGTNMHIDRSLDFSLPQGSSTVDPSQPSWNNFQQSIPLTNLDLTNDYHTFGLEWLPNSVAWYIDGIPVRRVAGHSPPFAMNLIAGMGINWWNVPAAPAPPAPPGPPLFSSPQIFEIDYVRVSKSTRKEMLFAWDNNNTKKIASWELKPDDRFVVGDFDNDGRSELLAFSSAGWSHLMRWDGSAWQYLWGNNGIKKIALWELKPDDRFVVGDFDNDGRNELLAFSSAGWSHLMRWDGSAWQYLWGNNGIKKIASWELKPDDRFVVGDFDSDGRSELLAFSSAGWSHLMRWDGSAWQYLWGNNGIKKIALWELKPDDRFVVGDFDSDGRSELLAFSSAGWSHLMRWDGSAWQYLWGNNGIKKIALWELKPDDRFVVGDFDNDGRSELLAFSSAGWSHLMRWDGSAWQYLWGNSGGSTIHRWFMSPSDKFYAAHSFGTGSSNLIVISADARVQLIKYELLP